MGLRMMAGGNPITGPLEIEGHEGMEVDMDPETIMQAMLGGVARIKFRPISVPDAVPKDRSDRAPKP